MKLSKRIIFSSLLILLFGYIFFFPKRAWVDIHNDTGKPIKLSVEGNDTIINSTYFAPYRFYGEGIFGKRNIKFKINNTEHQVSMFLFMNRYTVLRVKENHISSEVAIFRPMYN